MGSGAGIGAPAWLTIAPAPAPAARPVNTTLNLLGLEAAHPFVGGV
ncbi:MAG: hypothetical protein HGA30_05785 [Anaerolineales bacterium]|nr:hypothetical protein [Anaerolineales bacterium]